MKRDATGLLSHAVGRTERLSAWNEVFALVLLFAGTLLFFALNRPPNPSTFGRAFRLLDGRFLVRQQFRFATWGCACAIGHSG